MKKLLFGFAIFSITTVAHAAIPTVTDFPFEKEVQLPSLSSAETVQVPFDLELINAVSSRLGNISLYDKENTAIEYDVFFQDFYRIKNAQAVEVSSARMGSDNQLLVDNNVLTTFVFDERVDGRNASWVLIDLGKALPLTRLETFIPEGTPVRYMALEAGRTKDSLKTLVSKRSREQRLELSTDPVRFVKVLFWGAQVKIDDIRITIAKTGGLSFTAEPGKKYRVLYGGKEVDRITYRQHLSTAPEGASIARLGRQKFNSLFPEDLDDDGVVITEDNCPLIKNSSQKDSDGDRVGNECDNAPEVLNSRQEDTDGDSVGDIIDNCKLVVNPDQADRDEDGWGDACDSGHANETDFPSPLFLKIAGTIGVIALGVLGLWFWNYVRKAKK